MRKDQKKELNTLDEADFVRDVDKSAYHHLSQNGITDDNPSCGLSQWAIVSGFHRACDFAAALVDAFAGRNRLVLPPGGGLGPARLRTITEFVHAKMEDELTLVEVAQSMGLSPAHFSRMFRESTGETPHQFVMRERVGPAKLMLSASEARVLDVAVACGFKTPQHFARVFRRTAALVLRSTDTRFCPKIGA